MVHIILLGQMVMVQQVLLFGMVIPLEISVINMPLQEEQKPILDGAMISVEKLFTQQVSQVILRLVVAILNYQPTLRL